MKQPARKRRLFCFAPPPLTASTHSRSWLCFQGVSSLIRIARLQQGKEQPPACMTDRSLSAPPVRGISFQRGRGLLSHSSRLAQRASDRGIRHSRQKAAHDGDPHPERKYHESLQTCVRRLESDRVRRRIHRRHGDTGPGRSCDVLLHPGAVDPSLGFSPGQTLAGSYTFESTTILSNPDNRYNGAITSLTGSLSPYTATLGTGSNFIAVRNDLSTGDHYLISAPLNPLPAVTGLSVRFEMELIDPTATAFTSEALATTPPSLSAFATKSFRLVFEDAAAQASVQVRGTVTSLTAVPLPAAVVLFGAGLVALAGLGAGSRRQQKTSITA